MPDPVPGASPDVRPETRPHASAGPAVPRQRGAVPAPSTTLTSAGAAGTAGTALPPPAVEPRPLRGLLRGCRPRQVLTKNALVLTAPALGGHLLTDAAVLPGAVVAYLVFAAASAAVYLLNDVHDVAADRCHPVKCRRPVASGELPVATAVGAGLLLAALGLGLAWWWAPALAAVVASYLLVQVAYSVRLKHVPGLDLLVVVSGFVLRVVAGGVAAPVELSAPFVAVVALGTLFMVAGKRWSEMRTLGAAAGTRRSLHGWSPAWLRATWVGAAAGSVVAYAVAAARLGTEPSPAAVLCAVASVPAFAAGVLRYADHVRRGEAGCPESVVFGDRLLQVLALVWAAPLVAAVALA